MFGPFEHEVTEIYRRFFVDLDEFAELIHAWVPRAHRILEVGCGEGAMTERIVKTYPGASITAIDISPKVGRLFRGDASAVTFCQETVESVASREPASFDLVVLADVMHHVPIEARGSLLLAINQSLAPGGSLLFKEWVVSASPVHWACYFTCRYLTGDNVAYYTARGITTMLTGLFGPDAIRQVGTVRPWRNNVAFLVQHSQAPFARMQNNCSE
jgi:2-polyprenyl-6-hydroxyphenyl methylase/3-demethylubiquinone-9 3-methyltransferase